jgi:putative GTP pyrophosphokinase
VRTYMGGGPLADQSAYADAIEVIQRHRAAHQGPMVTANVGLRGFCQRLNIDARVTQRLKRLETIREKLAERETGLSLDRMQDIGGCRVVVPSIEDAYALQDRLVRRHPEARVRDYIKEPRVSGYRAIHVIAEYGRSPRKRVEIQIRTTRMHEWADMVERMSGALGVNYKQDGDHPFQRWARLLAEVMRLNELGQPISDDLFVAYDLALKSVFPAFEVEEDERVHEEDEG